MNWKITIFWSALIFLTTFVVGLIAHTVTDSEVATSGVIFVASSLLYFAFLRCVPRRFAHAIAAFVIVESIDWAIPLILGASLGQLLGDWSSSAKHLGAAIVGFTIASRRSLRRVNHCLNNGVRFT